MMNQSHLANITIILKKGRGAERRRDREEERERMKFCIDEYAKFKDSPHKVGNIINFK